MPFSTDPAGAERQGSGLQFSIRSAVIGGELRLDAGPLLHNIGKEVVMVGVDSQRPGEIDRGKVRLGIARHQAEGFEDLRYRPSPDP